MLLPETTRGNSFEAGDQFGERHFRRVFHEQIHVVILAMGCDQERITLLAEAGEEVT